MDSQKITSKTSLLNLMLLKAWRERWTDSQWGINIKTVLPRGVSGDVYNLAECILQQALIGSDANKLVLSYLKHSLCSHLVSHASVLKQISRYEKFDKVYCIISLLEFLESIINGVTCRSKPEESSISNAILSIVYWLSRITEVLVENYKRKSFLTQEQQEIIEFSANILQQIVNNYFLMSVIYVGKHENPELFTRIGKTYNNIQMIINKSGIYETNIKCVEDWLRKIIFIDIIKFNLSSELNNMESITYCIQPLLTIEILLKPGQDSFKLVSKLLMIKRLKNYTTSRLYYEILKASLMSLYNVIGTPRESIWCAFTFKKIPLIFKQLHHRSLTYQEKSLEYSIDLIEAFETLAIDPILNFMDTKYACNTLECLLTEIVKQHLIGNIDVSRLSTARDDTLNKTLAKLDLNGQQPSMVIYVMRTEAPLTGILKTLNSDYNKVQEALLGMFFQVLHGGNSLELILSVATVEGKLGTFVSRLIKCNESSKQVPGESGKQALVRSSLFDVSFLVLTFIMQTYGSDIVLDERGGTFFEKWVRDCMIERNKRKSPMSIVQSCNPKIVDELLLKIRTIDGGLKCTNVVSWHEICMNIPAVLYHLLLAWENEAITAAEVKIALDNFKLGLTSYYVCAASWLCSYIQVIRDDELLKPINMIQQFLTPLSMDEIQKPDLKFEERLGLSFQIIRKMQHDIPAPNSKIRPLMLTYNLVSQIPLEEQFTQIWKLIATKGWLPMEAAQTLDSLLQSCGPLWLVTKLINEIMHCKYEKEMIKLMDIVFAVLHLNIEKCTIALISELLPMYLLNKLQNIELTGPNSIILAKLCVYAILATLESSSSSSMNNKKRSQSTDLTAENLDFIGSTNPKLRKTALTDVHGTTTAGGNDSNSSSDYAYDNISMRSDKSSIFISDVFQNSIQNLFKMFAVFLLSDDLSPKILFIYNFLSLFVQCGTDRIKYALKLLPQGLIQNLLKLITINQFTVGFILRIYDLDTSVGRTYAISDLCLLRNIQMRQNSIHI